MIEYGRRAMAAETLTFIHSGDLHLGAPFRGLRALSGSWSERLLRAIPEAWGRVVDACIDNQVDFLLLAGDIFDTDQPSYAHYRCFIEGLERLRDHGIRVYLCAGNHDPYPSWQRSPVTLPENARLFASDHPEFAVHCKDGRPLALIGCRGFTNQASDGSIARGVTRRAAEEACGQSAPFAVGMLHSGLWMDPNKAPVSEDELRAAGMDYWALGHIHMRYVDNPADPGIAYCGCIQGRDIKETGERGCLKVTLRHDAPAQLEVVPTASVEWQRIEVDVSEASGLGDVRALCVKAMFSSAESACEEMVARITLTGATELHRELERDGVLEDLRCELNESYPDSLFCDALIDGTVLPIDKVALAEQGMFQAAFLKTAKTARNDAASNTARLRAAAAARRESLPENMDGMYSDLVDRAEDLVLYLLEGEA